MQHPNPASPVRVAVAERQALALALRKSGGSYRTIATSLKEKPGIPKRYSAQLAYLDVKAALNALNEKNGELAEEVRRLELERLDELHQVHWPKALQGDLGSFDRILALMAARARYLGLDKATETKVDITIYVRELAEKLGLDPDAAVREAENVVRLASPR